MMMVDVTNIIWHLFVLPECFPSFTDYQDIVDDKMKNKRPLVRRDCKIKFIHIFLQRQRARQSKVK